MSEDNLVKMQTLVRKDQLDWLKVEALRQDRSYSWVLREILQRAMGLPGVKPPVQKSDPWT